LKEEALDRTLWRTRYGRDYGPVVTMNEWQHVGGISSGEVDCEGVELNWL
jgi:hypothetical protein